MCGGNVVISSIFSEFVEKKWFFICLFQKGLLTLPQLLKTSYVMEQVKDYESIVSSEVEKVFKSMEPRVSAKQMQLLHDAYDLAHEAHKEQRRKSGEPYIIHPIKVALIAAEELKLDTHSVAAAFLHDVVEDTPYTVEDIERKFNADVAFLVDMVTKRKKAEYRMSKQLDNYQQLLESMQYDVRALMIKLADRLHNMRTLASMRADKQMKIAGETDYFYAPMANRLGLFDVKTDLENLSFKFRCGLEYNDICICLDKDRRDNEQRLATFTATVETLLAKAGVVAKAEVYWRAPYSIWRRMKAMQKDYWHLDNRYYVRITFKEHDNKLLTEKDVCLRIYSVLTDFYNEKPGSFHNYIDQGRENSYKSINVMLLSSDGIWEDVQICSERMVDASRYGCLAEVASRAETRDVGKGVSHEGVIEWIEKFRRILKEIAKESEGHGFIENIKDSLYYDDVLAFTPMGEPIVLPAGSTAIDFAFELHNDIGMHAKYARINGKLSSIKTVLKRGDCVEIGTDDEHQPKQDWLNHVQSYKARHALRLFFADELSHQQYQRCPVCQPLPGGDCIGFREEDNSITMHRRNCPEIILQASKHGDSIVNPDFPEDHTKEYPVTICIKAINRYHFLIDVVNKITNDLHLSIDSLTTVTHDEIVSLTVTFFVHSVRELVSSMQNLYSIPGVDSVRQKEIDEEMEN